MITLEPLDVDEHGCRLHRWVTHPRSAFWMMQDATPAEVVADYRLVEEHPHHDAWLGRVDGEPAFLAETYDPVLAPEVGLADLPELRPGDLGMHVLVAPTDSPRRGFTRGVFGAVMAHCFADAAVERVVVEPDVRNERIAVLNEEAGFVVERVLDLPGKQAALSFCTRADWKAHR
ncbi:GNAT family N-acetyltransferase [Nocardioides sp.]|uniref:GNAT family N-acetyltransferase n=1 Tax=Nocardioides sp. TaxID=35761 RepID=UPI00271D7010|nr:GNAT family N-acetyltransferase [Nocardioides sp.]MDO9454895.1 GNAT family N-acetyltransferase [Nocardioides sp.]